MIYKYEYKTDGERSSLITANAYKTLIEEQNITSGNFLIFSDQKIEGTALQNVQEGKIAQIKDLYNQHLEAGFTSSATGTAYIFGYGQTDREKFMQLAISVLSNVSTFPVPIPTKDGSIIMHTQAQYQQILADINTFAWGAQNKLHQYTDQVQACTTVDEVNAIVVTF
jgi:hypothetical protein